MTCFDIRNVSHLGGLKDNILGKNIAQKKLNYSITTENAINRVWFFNLKTDMVFGKSSTEIFVVRLDSKKVVLSTRKEMTCEFADYVEYRTTPWIFFERLKKFHLTGEGITSYAKQTGSPFASSKNYDTTETRVSEPHVAFQRRTNEDMLNDFFIPSGKPKLIYLGMQVDRFIIWSVTQGRYRVDTNKKVFAYQGTESDILKLKYGDAKMWRRVDESSGFLILKLITKTCNELYTDLLEKLSRYEADAHSHYAKNCLTNLRNHPEFVAFQRYRGYEHKNYKWVFQPEPQGGGKEDREAAISISNKKHSVHRSLLNYHFWLPSLKK